MRFAIPLGIFAAVVGAHSFGNMGCADSMWSIPTAASLLDEGAPRLDRYLALIGARQAVFVQQSRGHYYTMYPFATSVLAMPGVAVLRPIAAVAFRLAPSLRGAMEDTQWQRGCPPAGGEPIVNLHSWTEGFIASTVVAVTAVLLFTIAREELGVGGALLVAFVFAFATSAWSTASRSLWQHGPSMLMLTLALYFQRFGPRVFGVGAALAAAYTIRPTNAIPLALAGAWVSLRWPRRLPAFLLGAGVVLAVFVIANVRIYGALLPPYYRPAFFGSNAFFREALGGQLVSPARGLFVYSPVLLGAIAGGALKLRQRRFSALDLSLALSIVCHWIAISGIRYWWAGHSYGPRFFTDMVPYLVYFLIPVIGWIGAAAGARRAVSTTVFAAATAVGERAMSATCWMTPADRESKTAQDARGTAIGTSDDLQVDLISRARMRTCVGSMSTSLTAVERSKRVWTLTSLWTHRTRPHVTLKTADSFQQRPHPSFLDWKEESRAANGKQNSVVTPSTKSDQGHLVLSTN